LKNHAKATKIKTAEWPNFATIHKRPHPATKKNTAPDSAKGRDARFDTTRFPVPRRAHE
jgi:hypothetical protein